jgi:hypothetical protein
VRFLIILLMAVVPGLAQVCPNDATTLIDNFKTGLVGPLLLQGTDQSLDRHQVATGVPGGVRREFFSISTNPFRQVGEYGVVRDPSDLRGGALVVGTGVREFFRLEILYGFDTNNNLVPLQYFPPDGCDRFRVTFDSSSRVVNFNYEVWTPKSSGSGEDVFVDAINMDENAVPFCIEFPFAKFVTNSPGVTQDFKHTGIDLILPIFQSGSAMGANDFALKRIELAQGNGSVNGVACTIANF